MERNFILLDIRLIRKNPSELSSVLSRRGEFFDMDTLLAIDTRRRELTSEVECRVAKMRQGSKQIGALKKSEAEDEDESACLSTLSSEEEGFCFLLGFRPYSSRSARRFCSGGSQCCR